MKCLILLFICLTLIELITANIGDGDQLPCPMCYATYDPVCAIPTESNLNGGKAKTFSNSCMVSVTDCGHTEERKFRKLIEIHKNSRLDFSEYKIIHKGECK